MNGARSSTATAKTVTASRAAGYVGRFAPSPTGPLHVGSLTTAVASFLEAHAHRGQWRVRIEDLDVARAIPGMADEHLRTLERFGFEWDGEVRVQSRYRDEHAAAFERLKAAGRVYSCTCSRADLASPPPAGEAIDEDDRPYPGFCRDGVRAPGKAVSWRLQVNDREIAFVDRWQGHVRERVAATTGDFIVIRRDGVTAYQLAVVVDDALQGVTDVVRGADLLSNTARQILLQEALGFGTPTYSHAPLVVGNDGRKLAKSEALIGIGAAAPATELYQALTLLHQEPPRELAQSSTAECWAWARAHWHASRLKNMRSTRLAD